MRQLREFDLQFALEAARTLREDVEYQPVAVEHATPGELLEVAFLARAQGLVDEDHAPPLPRRSALISSALPDPTKYLGSGRARCR